MLTTDDPTAELADALRAAAGAVLAARGLELDGQVRGVIRTRGGPDAGTGFGCDLGAGPPAGWTARDAADSAASRAEWDRYTDLARRHERERCLAVVRRHEPDVAARAFAAILAEIAYPSDTLAAKVPPGSRWRHRAGGVYEVVCLATREHDQAKVVVYRSGAETWTRPVPEFLDGRFTRLEDGRAG